MKYDFDSYLLYESSEQSPLTVKVRVELTEEIEGEVLKKAAQRAFSRYPYYRRSLSIDAEGGCVLKPTDAPILVREEGACCLLGGEETGGLFFAITYDRNAIYFNFAHSFCGACGAMPWIKTTIWQYLTDLGHCVSAEDIRLPDSPMEAGETALPREDLTPSSEPIGEYRGGDSFLPVEDYIAAYRDPALAAEASYYPILIRKDALMGYARDNDGSPNSVISAVMFKMAARAFPNTDQLAARIACNYRADVGCPDTYRDLVRFLHVRYKTRMKDLEIERLSTITRGAMYLQMEKELSEKEYQRLMALRSGIDAETSAEAKRGYAAKHSLLHTGARDTYTISYVGRIGWGGIAPYLRSVYTLAEGHLILEINAVEEYFCISFMALNRDQAYLDGFLQVLDEEGIPYQVGERTRRNLPRIKVYSPK